VNLMKGLESIKNLVTSFLKSSESYEKSVDEFIKELQKTLIKADLNVKLVFEFTKSIREEALKSEPPPGVLRREWFIKIVYDKFVNLFGGEGEAQVIPKKLPYILMLVGIQGSGKTTTAGKLALYYKRLGYKPGLITTDTYRPAAYEQLQQIASTIGVPFYGSKGDSDPVTIAVEGINKLINEYRCNIVIIDTAGRHGYGSEERLLEEMKELANAIKPDEVLLVIDAYIGQKAYELARKFHEYTPIGSIIITKIDGTAKGGGALSAVVATGAKIKFVCDGEKLEDIEVFNPKKFVSRLLGLGDLESLLKKFEVLEESKEIEKRVEKMITSGRITLRDVYLQLQSLRKLGPLKKVLEMIPGFSLIPSLTEEQLKLSEDKIKKWISVLDSMTYEELDNPSIIDRRRMRRIAVGSGTTINDVEELLKYYEQLNRLIKELRRKRGLLSKLGVKGLGT